MHKAAKTIIFLGPPGAGKGTQAARLSTALGIPAISTGEMLRQAAHSRSAIGKVVETVMAAGHLVSDELINQVVAERLRQRDCAAGCILDGYPRTISQARFLEQLLEELHLPEPMVFNFNLSLEKIVRRLSRRRQCPHCGGIFSVRHNARPIRCERDGALLTQRADDQPAAIRQRLDVHQTTFADLIDFYRARNCQDIDASRAAKQVSEALLTRVGTRIPVAAKSRSYVSPTLAHAGA